MCGLVTGVLLLVGWYLVCWCMCFGNWCVVVCVGNWCVSACGLVTGVMVYVGW